jgi:PAS domain S-box-containing protein
MTDTKTARANELANLQRELAQANAQLVAAHKKIEATERHYRSLIACLPIGIFELDTAGRCVRTNSHWQAISGLTAEESLGDGWQRALDQRDAPAFLEERNLARQAGQEFNREVRFVNVRGDQGWALVRSRVIPTGDGEAARRVSTVEDITERKQSQQRLELATASAQIGIWDWDVVANHKVWDAQMHVLYGTREEDYDGSFAAWQKRLHPDDRDRVAAAIDNALAGSKDYNTVFRVVWPNGEVRHLEAHGMVQRADDGSPRRMIGMNRDITVRVRAEEALKEQLALRERLAKIASIFPGIIYSLRLRPDGVFCLPYASPTIEEFFGVRAQDLVADASSLRDQMHTEDRPAVHESMAESARTLLPWRAEFRMRHPKKGLFWAEARSTPEREADGSILWHGFMTDITERKKAESQLHKLSRAVEQSPASVVITDPGGLIEYVNPKFCAVTGYSLEEVLGKNSRLLKSGETSREDYPQMWATIAAGEEWRGEFHNRKKNGELYWESASISPIRDEQGNVRHFVAVKEDITERKLLEARLEQQRAEYETILNSIGDGVHWLDAGGLIKYENPASARMLGYEVAELIGRPAHAIMHHIRPDGSAYPQGECPICMTLRDRTVRRVIDEVFWRKDGTSFDVEYSCTPVYERDGRSGGTVVTFTDITERKRAQAERERLEQVVAEYKANEERARLALEHERELSRIKGRFVNMVSHEFRTPLSIINIAAEVLDGYLDKMTEEERTEHLNNITSAVERMTQMMNDFLIHGNCANGKKECKPAWVAVEALCRRLIVAVPRYPGMPRPIKCVVAPEVGEAWLDEKILHHILGNLLNNAVKYSSNGQPVKLEVKRVAGSPQPNGGTDMATEPQLEFKVSDTGIGIPEADQARLYQTFHRASNVGNRPGTGMGLAIVKQFVDLLGGRIRFESAEGQGTTVWVHLPITSPSPPGER